MLKDLCFEIIQTCPNNCLFCSSNAGEFCDKIIDFETFKKVIDHLISLGGIEEISLSGGEPFLHPDIFKMVEYTKSKNIKTVIFTSGIKRSKKISIEEKKYVNEILEKELRKIEEHEPWNNRLKNNVISFYKRMLEDKEYCSLSNEDIYKLENLGLDKIVFDFQASSEEIYNLVMNTKNLYDSLLTSMIKMSRSKINVDIHFIPMKYNYKLLPDIIEMCNIANIKNLSLLNFVPQGRGYINKDKLMMNEDELREFVNIYNNCHKSFNGNLRVGIPLISEDTHKCNTGLSKMVIKYDGTVLPCPAFKEFDVEKLKQYGIKISNIYDNLDDVKFYKGTIAKPLCKQLYAFKNSIK